MFAMALTLRKIETVEMCVMSYSHFSLPSFSSYNVGLLFIIQQIWYPKYCVGPAEGSKKV